MITRAVMKEIPAPGGEADARVALTKDIFDEHATMSIAMIVAGEPWAAKVFFIEDEPDAGHLDQDAAAVRIHVERLKVTDLSAEPPVAEFTFA
ncbi:MAG: hypothetical protein LC663_03395 [Actinobacteria bacterium]|nr:hypothetical protein [Actinomycetota bacterium]